MDAFINTIPESPESLRKKFNLEIKKKISIVFIYSYLILTVLGFISLHIFSKNYLLALTNSQNYSISIQQWRDIANGILSGWNLHPKLDGLCIFDKNKQILETQGFCQENNLNFSQVMGKSIYFHQKDFEIRAHLKHSLWLVALIIPFVLLCLLALFFLIFKKTLILRTQFEILDLFNNYDSTKRELTEFQKMIQVQTEEIVQLKKKSAVAEVAAQVSHDIRSPLSALNMILGQLDALPEQSRILVRSSVNRISDIANSLLNHKRTQNSGVIFTPQIEDVMLASLIDAVVSEKRIAMREKTNIQIEARLDKSYGLFAKINPVEMKRLISNAINNSSEALGADTGLIEVILESEGDQVVLTIQDNGKGIPPHILDKLGTKGVTYGKEGTESGSGLGVYHAKKTIESFGGTYEIKTTVAAGTSVIITLKKEMPPNWFVQKIKLSKIQKIIATDDDSSILEIWRQRFGSINRDELATLETCSSGDSLRAIISRLGSESKRALYLIDYEFLGQKYNGLDLVEELGIAQNAILVSSRYEEPAVKERCASLGVKMIPKGLAGQVPIVIEKDLLKLDGILVDDDPLIKMLWEIQSKDKKKVVLSFADESEFVKGATDICRETPIYIDVNLANCIRGQDVATRIHQLGFQNIHLSTGYDTESVSRPAFIKSVLSKDFPL